MEGYKERMKQEYRELMDRADKLDTMLENFHEGRLDFEPTCPIKLLEAQYAAMLTYACILERRAEIEGVELHG